MTVRIAWGITGSGEFLSETVEVMKEVAKREDVKITVFLSKAAVMVVRWYKLWGELQKIFKKVLVEVGPNSPFLAGPLQIGKYDFLLVAPATANTVAKIVNGIADSLVTNCVAQAQKGGTPVYILPSDQELKKTMTMLPTGEKIEIRMREVDVKNTRRLQRMRGISVLREPKEIMGIIEQL